MNYWPSAAGGTGTGAKEADKRFNSSAERLEGERTKTDIGDNGGKWDDFKQVSAHLRTHVHTVCSVRAVSC